MPDEKPITVTPTGPRDPHTRTIRTRPVTFVCAECGIEVTEDLYPGPPPKYCNGCIRTVRQRQNAERVKRHRARKRTEG
jgi:hypothetical protein